MRRDKPDYEMKADGSHKEKAEYLGPPGRGNRLYFVPETAPAALSDVNLPVVVAEGEKKTLALQRLAEYESAQSRWLPVGIAGAWSWRGTVGKANAPDGERRDVKGPLTDFNLLAWDGRTVFLCFDNDVHWNAKVRAARESLAWELRRRGALVRLVELPK